MTVTSSKVIIEAETGIVDQLSNMLAVKERDCLFAEDSHMPHRACEGGWPIKLPRRPILIASPTFLELWVHLLQRSGGKAKPAFFEARESFF